MLFLTYSLFHHLYHFLIYIKTHTSVFFHHTATVYMISIRFDHILIFLSSCHLDNNQVSYYCMLFFKTGCMKTEHNTHKHNLAID